MEQAVTRVPWAGPWLCWDNVSRGKFLFEVALAHLESHSLAACSIPEAFLFWIKGGNLSYFHLS